MNGRMKNQIMFICAILFSGQSYIAAGSNRLDFLPQQMLEIVKPDQTNTFVRYIDCMCAGRQWEIVRKESLIRVFSLCGSVSKKENQDNLKITSIVQNKQQLTITVVDPLTGNATTIRFSHLTPKIFQASLPSDSSGRPTSYFVDLHDGKDYPKKEQVCGDFDG